MEAIGLIGAAAIGAGASMFSANQANQMSRDIAREQMDFQERMSNTAYQRAVKDMRKAGINPMFLANGGGSASTPTGASASVHQADIGQNITNALTAYMDYKLKNSQNKLLKAEEKTQENTASKLKAEKEEIEQRIQINKPKSEINETIGNTIKKAKEIAKKTIKSFTNKEKREKIKKMAENDFNEYLRKNPI